MEAVLMLVALMLLGGILAVVAAAFGAAIRSSKNNQRLDELAAKVERIEDRLHRIDLRTRADASAESPLEPAATVCPRPIPQPGLSSPTNPPTPSLPFAESLAPPSPALRGGETPRDAESANRVSEPPTAGGATDQPGSLQQEGGGGDTPSAPTTAALAPGDRAVPRVGPTGGSLEEALGGKVLVWIGGVALALAGAFLVKYSWDAGLLSPKTRLGLAAGFGVFLVAAAQWMHPRADRVGSALAGAGVAVLYGVVFAATSVYDFLNPWFGFGCMAGVTAAAVLLSLKHGRFVALLGLVGGFLTPALVGQGTESTGALFGYLLVLQIGLVVTTRQRGWLGLSALTLVGSLAWAVVRTFVGDGPSERVWVSGFVLASAAVFILNAARVQGQKTKGHSPPMSTFGMAVSAVVAAAALLGVSAVRGGYSPQDLAMIGLLGAGALFLARTDRRYVSMAWLTAGLALLLAVATKLNLDEAATIRVAAGYGALFAVGGWACGWRNARGTHFAVMSAVAGPVFLGVVATPNWPFGEFNTAVPWWAPGAMVVLYALAAAGLRKEQSAARAALAFAAAGTATWATGIAVDRPWVLPAWAALVPATVWVAGRIGLLTALRWSTLWNAALVAVGLGVVLVLTDWAETLTTSVVYGGALIAFALAAWRLRRSGDEPFAGGYASGAAIAGWLGLTRLLRLWLLGREALVFPDGLTHWSSFVTLWLAAGLAVALIGRALAIAALSRTGELVGGLGVALGVFTLLGWANPVFSGEALDGPIVFNAALLSYGGPIVLAWLLSAALPAGRADEATNASKVVLQSIALVWLVALAVLLVRHGFHRPDLSWPTTRVTLFESGTHGVGFLALGWGLWEVGQRRRDRLIAAGGGVIAMLGVLAAVLVTAGLVNPLWNAEPVGATPVLNGLLYLYGLPLALCVLIAARLRAVSGWRTVRVAFGVAALLLVFTLVSLEVRQFFAGAVLRLEGGPVDEAEWYAYSAAWALLGAAMLLGGLLFRSAALRYGSLAVFLLAVGKVFVLDTAHLDGLLRVASFLGLGATLMALGFVYQRYVFRKSTTAS